MKNMTSTTNLKLIPKKNIIVYGFIPEKDNDYSERFIFKGYENIHSKIKKDKIYQEMVNEFNRNKYITDSIPSNIFPAHKMNYLRFLFNASDFCNNENEQLKATLIPPFSFQNKNNCSTKEHINWYAKDTNTVITKKTFEDAINDSYLIRFCPFEIIDYENLCFICDNLGRYAGSDYYSNDSFINKVAVFTYYYRSRRTRPKIAILDIANSHGYGTQDIFYKTPEVFYASIHCGENNQGKFYEVGEESGIGKNYNQKINSDFSDFEFALKQAFNEINNFNPFMVVLSVELENEIKDLGYLIKKYNNYKTTVITNKFNYELLNGLFPID